MSPERLWRDTVLAGLTTREPEYRRVDERVVRALAIEFVRDPDAVFRGSLAELARLAGVPLSVVVMTTEYLISADDLRRLRVGLLPTTTIEGGVVHVYHPDALAEVTP